jgi:FkbM family methyltransferase
VRRLPFVLAASDHGPMIVSWLDRIETPDGACGVGAQILHCGVYESVEVNSVLELLTVRRQHFGDRVLAIDCGANIGVHTIEWAKRMTGWGSVLAIEAQERIFYALAGNIALNNCFNATAVNAAVGATCGAMMIPQPDYLAPANLGGLELANTAKNADLGQSIDRDRLVSVQAFTIDSLGFDRVDLIKIDVEGMEMEALAGAAELIGRCRPVLVVEQIKVDTAALRSWLEDRGYAVIDVGMNVLAVHQDDPTLDHVCAAK